MNIKKILLILLLVGAAVGAYIWFFVVNKSHDDIDDIKAKYKIEAIDLVKDFEDNHDSAWKKYNDNVLDVTGTVSSVIANDSLSSVVFIVNDNYEVYLEVYAKHNKAALALKPNDKVTIHGLFSGAEKPDEMLEISGVLRLKKCSFISTQ